VHGNASNQHTIPLGANVVDKDALGEHIVCVTTNTMDGGDPSRQTIPLKTEQVDGVEIVGLETSGKGQEVGNVADDVNMISEL
jgi:hypothetical protein